MRLHKTSKIDVLDDHQADFDTLAAAVQDRNVALISCTDETTHEEIAVLCVVSFNGSKYSLVPFAQFYNGDPLKKLSWPKHGGILILKSFPQGALEHACLGR